MRAGAAASKSKSTTSSSHASSSKASTTSPSHASSSKASTTSPSHASSSKASTTSPSHASSSKASTAPAPSILSPFNKTDRYVIFLFYLACTIDEALVFLPVPPTPMQPLPPRLTILPLSPRINANPHPLITPTFHDPYFLPHDQYYQTGESRED